MSNMKDEIAKLLGAKLIEGKWEPGVVEALTALYERELVITESALAWAVGKLEGAGLATGAAGKRLSELRGSK